MIRDGDLVRFTPDEIDQFRSVGLDATGIRTIGAFGAAVATWCALLEQVRPDVLEKLARAMADARGFKLPPKLTAFDCGTQEDKVLKTQIEGRLDRVPQFQSVPRQ
jgi:hypothetical protein